MAKRGCFKPLSGIGSAADQDLDWCKEQKGNCEGPDSLCFQNDDSLLIPGKCYDFQKENCVDQCRGFLKGFEAHPDAEQRLEERWRCHKACIAAANTQHGSN